MGFRDTQEGEPQMTNEVIGVGVLFTVWFTVLFSRVWKLNLQIDELQIEQKALSELCSALAELLAKDRRGGRDA